MLLLIPLVAVLLSTEDFPLLATDFGASDFEINGARFLEFYMGAGRCIQNNGVLEGY